MRFHWIESDQNTDGLVISELNLNYDFSPEQTYLKLLLTKKSSVNVDLFCNQFEYEILYKRTFHHVLISHKVVEEEIK